MAVGYAAQRAQAVCRSDVLGSHREAKDPETVKLFLIFFSKISTLVPKSFYRLKILFPFFFPLPAENQVKDEEL